MTVFNSCGFVDFIPALLKWESSIPVGLLILSQTCWNDSIQQLWVCRYYPKHVDVRIFNTCGFVDTIPALLKWESSNTCAFSAEGTLIFCVHSVLSWACRVDRAMLTQCKVSPAENGDADASSTSCRPARDGNNACPSRSSLNVPQHLLRSESAPANSLFLFL